MIKELRAWFQHHKSNDEIDKIDKDDITLQKAFAIVIYHVIRADDVETSDERKRFSTFFNDDFDLDEAHIHELHENASKFEGEFEAYLDVLKDEISDLPAVKLKLMQTINNIMQKGKFNEREFEVFEQVRKTLF